LKHEVQKSYRCSSDWGEWGGYEEVEPHDDWSEFEEELNLKEANLKDLRTFLPEFKAFLDDLGFNHIALPKDPDERKELKLPIKGDFIIFFQLNFKDFKELESLLETVEIMSDAEAFKSIELASKEYKKRNFIPFEAIIKEFEL